jgi:3D (Asp-Asp-Asp) domain-containing protein
MIGLCAGIVLLAPAIALAAPSTADLRATLTGPATSAVNTPTSYTATLTNAGPTTAKGVTLTVELPLTATSPQVYILGTVGGLDPRCVVVSNTIRCALADLRKGRSHAISFAYTAPVSTKALTMKAVGAMTNTDTNTSNNSALFTPVITHPVRVIPVGSSTQTTVTNTHCTGTGLTAFFECALFPSSLSSHTVTFNGDGTITLPEPGYTGTWSQPTSSSLHFEYADGTGKVAEFNGFAVNGSTCFDGMTNFFPVTTYVSPYHVCF